MGSARHSSNILGVDLSWETNTATLDPEALTSSGVTCIHMEGILSYTHKHTYKDEHRFVFKSARYLYKPIRAKQVALGG